ncbi:hypothetical protein [Microbacterium hydrocarbonoxydans]|uniref:hypothetical protein n=1 Tax=Microbacterium hydrocarbonoxydans TaxID=273678 RepID=UPI003D98D0E9
MNARNRIADALLAMRTEFEAEAIRLGATVHTDGDSLVAVWPEAARQTTSATLSAENGRLVLAETAMLRVPDGIPDELLQRFGHRAAVVGRLRGHLGMVERVTGVPLLAPPDELKVVRA